MYYIVSCWKISAFPFLSVIVRTREPDGLNSTNLKYPEGERVDHQTDGENMHL